MMLDPLKERVKSKLRYILSDFFIFAQEETEGQGGGMMTKVTQFLSGRARTRSPVS